MALTDTNLITIRETLTDADRFSESYRREIFLIWYENDKPSGERLQTLIGEDPSTGQKPAKGTLENWIRENFRSRASLIDQRVIEQMDQTMVEHKLERLQRHADLAKEMQQMGIEYLRDHGLGSAKNALTALIRGIQIEEESLSLPKFLKDMDKMSDGDLIEEMRKLVHESGPLLDLDAKDADLDA